MVSCKEQDITDVRHAMVRALNSRRAADAIYRELLAVKNKSPLIIAYTGYAEALKAKHAWNPYYKLKYVKDAERWFAEAVKLRPHQVEIRFLRFSVEYYVPGLLGYNKHLDEDRAEIIGLLHKRMCARADRETVLAIIRFMLQSKRCTTAENIFLNRQLKLLK